uniref:Sec-independent periplasmic protein translocase n=1 Tax=Microzonia abyssicola TaxID=217214 RepID=UPI002E762053|nr:Sec-independent periplasmic protein translocase [Syringoderma abyssicola]WAM65047.1 Sec-independent periplasmic protein translocase [Syringoderma abyssicola]
MDSLANLTKKEEAHSFAELYFNEHYHEIRHRLFHTTSFFAFVTVITFCNIKLLVKILESAVANVEFFQLSPGEYFTSTLVISVYSGLLFSSTFLLSQVIFFYKPALTINEKSIISWLLLGSLILFVLGLLFSYYILIPAALNFFILYAADVLEPFWSFNQYFTFVSALFLSTGLVFQLPVVQVMLTASNVIDPIKMLNFWRPMILLSTILGAILTPSADPITQILLSLALFILYAFGTYTAIRLEREYV